MPTLFAIFFSGSLLIIAAITFIYLYYIHDKIRKYTLRYDAHKMTQEQRYKKLLQLDQIVNSTDWRVSEKIRREARAKIYLLLAHDQYSRHLWEKGQWVSSVHVPTLSYLLKEAKRATNQTG